MLRLLKSTVKKSSIHGIVKKDKVIHTSFVVASQTAEVTATMDGKHGVKMERH